MVFWVVIVLSAFLLWHVTRSGATANQTVPEISYSDFLARVANNQVKNSHDCRYSSSRFQH